MRYVFCHDSLGAVKSLFRYKNNLCVFSTFQFKTAVYVFLCLSVVS
ncbi:hypothetical protein AcetOrient_orf03171 [Acetobacter orientalis]|uniref:Uncharacterized protein n=1 Tax=Acetobacter orientalis TaxID=146474 RepID=A0A2Z5ZIS1_9PROT|nr:hypothetical protein AcetOrient_orf03171 [Acetobacter orientalis]